MGFLPLGDDNSMRQSTPVVVYGLIGLNLLMWIIQLINGDTFTNGYATIPYEITHGVDLVATQHVLIDGRSVAIPEAPGPSPIYLTLVTAMFMHGSWMHILGNMLYLWIFGDQIEDLLGKVKFIIFYLLCGLAASAAQIAGDPEAVIPNLGASGAIAGVLGAYLVKYPTNGVRVIVGNMLTTLPAFIVLGVWIALQAYLQWNSLHEKAEGGVAYLAHLGGFASGIVLIFLFTGTRRTPVGYDGEYAPRDRDQPWR
jgi:membrane associated rhomboid family serine protease